MSDAAWKAHERAIAKRLGGKRVGPAGPGSRGELGDVVADGLAVECKERKALPDWLTGAMAQAVKASKGEDVPVVVLHELGKRHENDLVVLRLRDFEAMRKESE